MISERSNWQKRLFEWALDEERPLNTCVAALGGIVLALGVVLPLAMVLIINLFTFVIQFARHP